MLVDKPLGEEGNSTGRDPELTKTPADFDGCLKRVPYLGAPGITDDHAAAAVNTER